MDFLPTTLGTRPRLACEVRPEGVVAARSENAAGLLSAVSRVAFTGGLAVAQLRLGSEDSTGHSGDRATVVSAVRKALEAVALKTREVTLVVPDAAVRVLLLDFDALPSKEAEALPVVRFRLKKLLPFDADDAAVSYQGMTSTRNLVRVVAVAMPREVLTAYEAVVREAGFEPGAVLPSTLAALAGLGEDAAPRLVVNAGRQGVTTAIVQGGVLLLHRSVDLRAETSALPSPLLPLVDRESSAEEWAMQEPARFPSSIEAEAAIHTAVLQQEAADRGLALATGEVVQAISRAAAYFEDTLEAIPESILATGTLTAATLATVLTEAGMGPLPVLDMVTREMLGPGVTAGVPMGWLAGVRGALAD